MTNTTKAFNQNLELKKELYKDNVKALKQLDWLAVAFDLASEAEYDKALDIVTSVKVGSKIALDYISQYTQKWELKVNYDKVQANALGIYEVNVDSLAKDEWWRVVEVEDKTITIAKTGEELLSSLVNAVANF
jgi:hypothetical protein